MHGVRVKVDMKTPAGYLCPSLEMDVAKAFPLVTMAKLVLETLGVLVIVDLSLAKTFVGVEWG